MTLEFGLLDLPKLFLVPDAVGWDANDEGYAVLMDVNDDGYLTVCDYNSLVAYAKKNRMTEHQAADFILRHSVIH